MSKDVNRLTSQKGCSQVPSYITGQTCFGIREATGSFIDILTFEVLGHIWNNKHKLKIANQKIYSYLQCPGSAICRQEDT